MLFLEFYVFYLKRKEKLSWFFLGRSVSFCFRKNTVAPLINSILPLLLLSLILVDDTFGHDQEFMRVRTVSGLVLVREIFSVPRLVPFHVSRLVYRSDGQFASHSIDFVVCDLEFVLNDCVLLVELGEGLP